MEKWIDWITVSILFIAMLGLSLVPRCTQASDWTTADTQRELAYVAISVIDMGQTMDIRNHDDIEEGVPFTRAILGRNPEPLPTAAYFAATTALHYGISRALPRGWREGWQSVTIVVNGAVVANNWAIGLRWGY